MNSAASVKVSSHSESTSGRTTLLRDMKLFNISTWSTALCVPCPSLRVHANPRARRAVLGTWLKLSQTWSRFHPPARPQARWLRGSLRVCVCTCAVRLPEVRSRCPPAWFLQSCSPAPTALGLWLGPRTAGAGPPAPWSETLETRLAPAELSASLCWSLLRSKTSTYTLIEHVCLVPEGGVLAQMLSDHLHPLHLQPLQLLWRTVTAEHV